MVKNPNIFQIGIKIGTKKGWKVCAILDNHGMVLLMKC